MRRTLGVAVVLLLAILLFPSDGEAQQSRERAQSRLGQNYPNPFNPSTTIRFALPISGDVRLEVYTMLGQRMAVLVQGHQPAGWHTVTLNANTWASGTYIYVLRTPEVMITQKLLLIK